MVMNMFNMGMSHTGGKSLKLIQVFLNHLRGMQNGFTIRQENGGANEEDTNLGEKKP